MIRYQTLVFAVFLLPVFWCFDSFLITSIEIRNDVGNINCTSSNLTVSINELALKPLCQIEEDANTKISYVTLTYNETESIPNGKNITFNLESSVTVKNYEPSQNMTNSANYQFMGIFVPDKSSKANTVLVRNVTLNKVEAPATTSASKFSEADVPISNKTILTVTYIHIQYDDSTKKEGNSNGGAVAVAIIEGIALIAILAYMGYRTMVKHRMKESTMNAALYGYDNNSRSEKMQRFISSFLSLVTVPDSIRMSDIPPPRDPTYATPPTPTVTQQTPTRNTVMTTQELVVPPTQNTSAPAPTRPTTGASGQFNDPFDSLDSW
ncbi:CRE-SID-2 protein [Caenorhabditis remanei]|uniref:CRE-SID-2 protein n=1 Tax=Caenorhabditis remanei TaxID=31234 RepID=E3LYG5_CAERE|nr:CRE-SID-2 protein [Caenorhabditis remanei]